MYKNKKSGPGPPEIESSVPTHLPNHTTSLQQPKADFHDAPFSADALEKRFSPPGKLQGRSSGSSLSQRLPGPRGPVASVLRPVRNLQQRELLPIFTAFPFNRSGGCGTPLRTIAQQKYKKFGFARPYNEKRSPYGDLSEPKPGLEPGTSSLRVKRSTN